MLLIVLVILLTIFLFVFIGFHFIELIYAKIFGKPIYTHFYIRLKRLNEQQKSILKLKSLFYRRLPQREKRFFEHRVKRFIEDKEFLRRDGEKIIEEMYIIIAATAVMLTFGMRNYLIKSVKRILIYPDQYESLISQEYHLGEYNKALQTIVFSWKHFMEGIEDTSDNLNLGVHEFSHALSIESLKSSNINAVLFADGLDKINMLFQDKKYMSKLKRTQYFRAYALTNKYEFFAVTMEHFIETPRAFKSHFPEVHNILKKMLNYCLVEKWRAG